MTETVRLALPTWASGITQPDLVYNDAALILDLLVAGGAKSRTTTAQPGAPAEGDVYIIPSGATGDDWSTFAQHDIAYFLGGVWNKLTPVGNPSFWVDDANEFIAFNGTSWVEIASAVSPYDIGFFVGGLPDNGEVVLKFVAVRTVTLPAALSGSRAHAGAAATAEAVFNVQKNGSNVGTITFAAAGTTGTFAMASGQTLAVGDRLSILAPATADATLADISITLTGTR